MIVLLFVVVIAEDDAPLLGLERSRESSDRGNCFGDRNTESLSVRIRLVGASGDRTVAVRIFLVVGSGDMTAGLLLSLTDACLRLGMDLRF